MIEGTLFDYVIHTLTVLTSVTLFIVSAISYRRHKREKFFYICAGFFLFAVKEIITGVDVMSYHNHTLVGITHLIDFAVMIFFFIGVMK